MNVLAGDISAVVFRPVVKGDLGNFSLDGHMLSVLMALDGKLPLEQIVQKTGLKMASMREAVAKLQSLKLIAPVAQAANSVDREFMNFLVAELSLAIGPLAEVIVEDELEDMGHSFRDLPTKKIAELVNLLALEIHREEKKSIFKKNMVQKIKEKGY